MQSPSRQNPLFVTSIHHIQLRLQLTAPPRKSYNQINCCRQSDLRMCYLANIGREDTMQNPSIRQNEHSINNTTFMRVQRWMYHGQRPNWIAKILNRMWAIVASLGVTSNYMETLEVTGRKSGRIISFPVVIALVDGQRYLVSMLGEDVQWVRNVRAAGGRAALHSGGREEIHLEEISVDQRAPILKAYLQRAPGARPHVRVNKDAPITEFEKIAAEYPVFRVSPREAK